MKRMSWRAALLLIVGVSIASITAGCTLSGATQAPPPDTSVIEQNATEAVLPTTQAPIIASPTKPIVVGTPTTVATFDTFATVTANAQITPGSGVVVGAPTTAAGAPTSAVGVVTPTAVGPITTPTLSALVTKAAGAAGSAGCPSTYTVQSGENLYRIALKFNLTVAQLAAANGIANANFIIVGTILKIPGCGTTPATTGGATPTPIPGTSGGIKPQTGDTVATNGDILHTVKSGENLYRIALAYGLSWQAVATYNGITSPDQLVVGQVVHIPTK